MLTSNPNPQQRLEMVIMEDLVPKNHLLRKIDQHIDFGFIPEKVKHLYCLDNGRPSVDPTVLFKMMFIGYLFGIRSERRLAQEIEVNLAYRWFLGLGLTDPVPHHSTISQNRRRRFRHSNVFQDIFDEIVLQAMNHGLVEGKELFTDSTHLKANANRHKFIRDKVRRATKDYVEDLDKAIAEDRRKHGKKPLRPQEPPEETAEIRVSTTDPESGYMTREGKPEGFFYLDHRTVDGKCNLITDVHVTPATVRDSNPYIERLDRQRECFGFQVEAVALDAGYLTTPICNALRKRDIFAVIGHRRFHPARGLFHKWQYRYDAENDCYLCANGQRLNYATTSREGYRQYVSDPQVCRGCELRPQCTRAANYKKILTRHVWEDSKEWVNQNRLSERGKEFYKRRKETIERSFADSKELHGLRYCRYRGLAKVREQCLLTAVCQNIKKMALHLARRGGSPLRLWLFWLHQPQLCIV